MKQFALILLTLWFSAISAFAPQLKSQSSTSLNLFQDGKNVLPGLVVGAILAISSLDATPANAFSDNDFGSSQILAARSGGRMGGRSMGGGGMGGRPMGGSRSYAAPVRNYSSTTTIIRPMIAPSPFGFGGGYGYGYNPLGGIGLGYGLGAMNNAGNAQTDYRQETEIQQNRGELEQTKQKAMELENRLKLLEQKQ
mmetsp:Transcript_43340/g.49180  ORF Transcript_43340/g.49180 Transcript_43340/m.49180 type:complete len:196 (+) Transcript_43340:59-646(+)